jgi:tetratricopeptide (TPR) repeat protein
MTIETMSEGDSISNDSAPSAASTEDSSMGEGITAGESCAPPFEEVIDRSGEPDAVEKGTKLKDLGNKELGDGHFLQAIGFYSEGLEYQPDNAILLSNRALAYIKVENYGLAQLDADHSIESDPTYAKAYYRRASASFALDHYKDARKDLRQVCKLRPKDRDARNKLKDCERAIREEAFCKAIEAEQTAPLSSTYDPSKQEITSSYEGPHPSPEGLLTDMVRCCLLFCFYTLREPLDPAHISSFYLLIRMRKLPCLNRASCLATLSWLQSSA